MMGILQGKNDFVCRAFDGDCYRVPCNCCMYATFKNEYLSFKCVGRSNIDIYTDPRFHIRFKIADFSVNRAFSEMVDKK